MIGSPGATRRTAQSVSSQLSLKTMLKNFQLSQKFNILLITIFAIAVIVSGVAFSAILSRNTEQQVSAKTTLLLQTMLSVRQYTLDQIAPELTPRLETETEFLPQTVPGYSAREVFEDLRKNPEYNNFFYKEATLNPTNLRDQADSFETNLVKNFKTNSALKETTGYRPSPAGDLFYIARPIAITKESCLRCHSTPEAAPKSLLTTYGSANGFGWKLNDIVGAQVISIPASLVSNSTQHDFSLLMGIIVTAFAAIFLLVNFLLKYTVIRPLNLMAKVANEISMGNMQVDFERVTNDEIGKLAAAFNRLKTSLVMAMNMLERE